MFELTTLEIENLIDLVEIKMLAMQDGNFSEESDMASLKTCRVKLLKIVEGMPGVTLIPFDNAFAI